jgi:hypothetical protein
MDNSFAQCGAGVENIKITNYCNNQYACWAITNPSTASSYRWNASSSYDVTNPAATGTDYGYSTSFCSPTRLATPTGTATGQVQYYYVKETPAIAIPAPSSLNVAGSPPVATFSMTFTTTSVIRMNSVEIPIVIYTPANTYQTQIEIQGSGGTQYSPVYSFTGSSAIQISGQDYYVTVPVNLSLTAPGVYTISVVKTSSVLDGIINTNGAYSGGTYPSLSIGGGVLNPIYSGTNSSIIYNWNYTSYCGPSPSGYAYPTTTGCCTPILYNPTVGAATNIIQTGSQTVTISAAVFSSTVTGYYQWYLNGNSIPGANGPGPNETFIATTAGIYTARVADNAADINNVSCYAQSNWELDERAIFAAITSSPGVGPYCIGNVFMITATTSGSDITWTPSGTLTEISPYVVQYTANVLGDVQISVSANITMNDKILNGNFETGVISPSSTQLSYQNDPGGTNGSYTIKTSVPAQVNGTGNNSFWEPCTGTGDFFIANGFDGTNSNNVVWSQTALNITPGQNYTLSFDITNISTNANVPQATGADIDIQLQVYINGVTVGGVVTSGANGLLSNVCNWTTVYIPWTDGTSDTQANIQIKQVNLFQGGGLDFGLDNIHFGGLVSQNAQVIVGPITDCSSIKASESGCSGNMLTLSSTVAGGMVFDYWKDPLGNTIGTTATLTVSSTLSGIYTAYGNLPLTSLQALQNGDFESGNVGFLNGNPTYFAYQSSLGGGGNNTYTITTNSQDGNGSWVVIPPAPSPYSTATSVGTNIFVSDEKTISSPKVGNDIVGWTFSATAGEQFQFYGYAANLHNSITCTSALCGYDVWPGFIGIVINNVTVTSLNIPRDNNWHQMSAVWTAPTTGSFTLNVVDLSSATAQAGFGDDVALDNFSLTPLYAMKTATVSGPACVLPVTFESFNLSKVSKGVNLIWNVSEEINVRDYSVERSNDGVNFLSIGSVPYRWSVSSGGFVSGYSFIDTNPIIGTGYYRIREIDLDGYSTLTNIESIDLTNVVNSIVVVPNLVSKGDPITVYNHTSDPVYVSVQSLDGKEIDQQTILTPGANTYYTSKLSAGMYLFHFQSNGILSVKKVVVQ